MKTIFGITILLVFSSAAFAQEAKPGTTFKDCPVCPEMVVIPPGEFVMGSPIEESGQTDEKPQHKVKIAKPFAVGKLEVTFDQWDACTAEGKCPKASDDDLGRGERPAININWGEARGYAQWLSQKTGKKYRLLSESEWEYSARAGTTTPWYWGISEGSQGSFRTCQYANVHDESSSAAHPLYVWSAHPCDDGFAETAPAGKFKPNAFGLHDMSGNVREWIEDCFHLNYTGAPADGSAWQEATCEKRVVRGGGWIDGFQTVRSAYRHTLVAAQQAYHVGFRIARDL
jgi:formylglycine-generating enzyme required for sulfatase activity